ncbi:MAG: hypothetical protein KatS3mg033_1742 [Thermonema sp.]|uniref:tetratricopeptide repeat protein n=1 Tax=Thermonema sp. TaxID=2231181 RepID=UPI0021DC401A|nr:tetratricopeptide repeat protein [Thermonema sp.]GIV39942.1 MAG: hypothetical protein KatS3mg033_1742 [Thermonema sp.]
MAKTSNKDKETPKANESLAEALVENPEVVLNETTDFLKRNRQRLTIGLVALVAVVGAFMAYRYMKSTQQEEALNELFAAETFFALDSTKLVLEGNGNYLGALQVAEEYPMAEVEDAAHFYAGVAYLKEGNYEQAIAELKQFKAKDALVQARAYALLGDAHAELKQWEEAVAAYEKAAKHKPNPYFTPVYLMKQALAYEQMGKWAEAVETYDVILKRFPNAQVVNEAKKYKARAEQLSSTPSN